MITKDVKAMITYSFSYADGGTHGQPDDHDRQHVHELAADGNRRYALGSVKLADDEQIRQAI